MSPARTLKASAIATTLLATSFVSSPHATAQQASPLSGQVSSAAEGPMEGVLVSAKKADSNITITVVTDSRGAYRFPSSKLTPGHYDISIRAIGYDLEGPNTADVTAAGVIADVKLKPTADLSLQLTNAEWIDSFQGTPQQKGVMLVA